ncbi:MAG: hypothetical protein O2795_11950 [Acidobacteria bacterium]|nr:hypothetical protein [Acidobacteriota bacterium]
MTTARLISLGCVLGACSLAQQGDQQRGNTGPIRMDPTYRSIAAATGGHAMPIEPAELGTPGAATLLVALGTYDAKILAIDQATVSGPRSYEFPVDGSVRGLSVIVSGAAKVALKGPDGFDVVAGPAGIEVVRLNRVTGYMIDTPKPGLWSVYVDASEPYLLTAEAKSAMDLLNARFVEPGGRPGHEGLFPIQGNPAAGEPGVLEISMMNPLPQIAVSLRKPNGEMLLEPAVSQQDGEEFWANFTVPSEPFRVYVRAEDAKGNTIQRAQSATVSPQRFFVKAAEPMLSVWPGDAVAVRFRFENKGEASSFVAYAVLDDGSLAPVEPKNFDVGAGRTVQLTVNLKLPFDARPGSQRELMLTVTNNRSGGYNSATQQIEVRAR